MDISESGQLYLKSYYILEQARKEAHQYLAKIAETFSSRVDERIKEIDHPTFGFRKYVQKDGGRVEFIAEYKDNIEVPELEDLGDLKYTIVYTDAMRNDSLSSSTSFVINAVSPKISAHLTSELKRVAIILNYPDPYSDTYGELMVDSFEDIVSQLTRAFLDRQSQVIQILEFLIKEKQLI